MQTNLLIIYKLYTLFTVQFLQSLTLLTETTKPEPIPQNLNQFHKPLSLPL